MKRLLDIIAASMALLLLSPVITIVALLVHHKLGSPILFKQLMLRKTIKIGKSRHNL